MPVRLLRKEHWSMPPPTVIEVTAKDDAAELKRQGIEPDERVMLTIEPELIPGRRETRKLVIAAGLSDADIDQLIKRAQKEVEPLLPK
jgi:hypothetical protein